ncbi:MAG: Inner membrane transport protein YdhC [Chlamydiia bacterium]|nr:Inner membrane transport protein YdhC [Chlamydiia bacterium]MCH9615160.1 Inner membrane transport protein YdhC [Chlamydiia bacterium]MCH9628518.1 Inner membrane transport protein YdhC [Chlamydiia bacterium]
MNKKTITFFILTLITVGQFGIDIYLPSLPNIAHALNTTHSKIQFSLTIYFIGFSFFQLLYGALSDRYGRRPLILLGLLLYILGAIAAGLATTLPFFYLARLIQGIGAAGTSSQARALMRDGFNTPQSIARIAALMSMMWSLIPVIAPLVGGIIEEASGWRMNFFILVVFGCINLILVYFFLRETLTVAPPRQSYYQTFKTVITNREFTLHTSGSMGMSFVLLSFITLAPFYMQKTLHHSPKWCGVMLFSIGLGYFIGATLISFLTKRYTFKPLFFFWGIAIVISAAILTLLQGLSIQEIILPMFAINLCMGALYPLFMTQALIPFPHLAGTAGALFGTMIFIAEGLGTLVACLLPYTSLFPYALLSTIIFLGVFLVASGKLTK